jgi:hypothetical protein
MAGLPVILGAHNMAAAETAVEDTGGGNALAGLATREGLNGVFGRSPNPNASGVYGESTGGGFGVAGRTGGANRPGVLGDNTGPGTGVQGRSNGGEGVFGAGATNGVHGETSNPGASGVYGENKSTGFGVAGRANSGTGVLADSSGGTALQVNGKASFSRSGMVSVAPGATSASVAGVSLTAASLVFATLQTNVGVHIQGVVSNPSGNSFEVFLSSAALVPVPVAWLVLN